LKLLDTHNVLCGSLRATLVFSFKLHLKRLLNSSLGIFERPDPVSHLTDLLVQALRGFKPDERRKAIAEALVLLEDQERRNELMKMIQALSTDELEQCLSGIRDSSKPLSSRRPGVTP
jgi:hypothetical protein